MVVCIVTDSFPPDLGGVATFYANLTELLTKNNNRTIVLMVDQDAHPDDEDIITKQNQFTKVILRGQYIRKFNFYSQYFRPGGLNAPHWIAMGFSIQEWLLKNHNKFKIDVIDIIDTGGLGIFLINQTLPPVVITGHGTIRQYYRINHTKHDAHFKLLLELERLSFKYADRVIAYSPLNQKDLENIFEREIHFSDPPWILKPVNNISVSGLPLTVSSIQKVKGIELLLNAIAIVLKHYPQFQCEWIGPDFYTAPGGKSMVSFIQNKYSTQWNRNILWEGELERADTISKIVGARFIIIPSVFETFNYVSLESASLGKGIIITEGAGASYLFTNNENALIVPGNPKDLAEAILQMCVQTDLAEKLGSCAKEMVKRVFDEKRIYKERIEHYNLAIQTKKENIQLSNSYLKVINRYITPVRKNYYKTRKLIKSIIKPQH